jgi:hypothetical protein
MLPLPYLVALALARGSPGLDEDVVGFGFPQTASGLVVASLWASVPVTAAGLLWAHRRSLRVLGYLGYSLSLALGAGVGLVLAVMNAQGSLEPRPTAPSWTTAVLGMGAALSVLSLVAVAGLVVVDFKASPA